MDYKNKSKEELIKEVERLHREKRYGLIWEEKPENVDELMRTNYPVLSNYEEKDIMVDNSLINNLLIEGDNLHSLGLLNTTHSKSIDLIYIDPPYNTGSDDFIYNDEFVNKENSWKHSKWISFMNRRLKLAKKLLKNDGVIFISINEEELFSLKLLCDEIFDEKNYLTTFTVKVRHEDRILKGDKDFHEVAEYLLMYRRSAEHKTTKRIQDNTSIEDYIYSVEELIDNPETITLGNKDVQIFRPNEYNIKKNEPNASLLKSINIRGSIKEGNSSGRFYMAHLEQFFDQKGTLFKVPDMGADNYGHRYFLIPTNERRVNADYFQGVPIDRNDIKEVPFPNFLDYEQAFNRVGYEGGVEFRNGKKPIAFLMKIFELAGLKDKKEAIVLDFFAGSGTTGEALLRYNSEDDGRRQFILCTNNEITKKEKDKLIREGFVEGTEEYKEQGICRKITHTRINNTIKGYEYQGKITEIIEEFNLTYTGLKKGIDLYNKIDEVKEEHKDNYDEIKILFNGNKIIVNGIKVIKDKTEGIPSNLKYFITDIVPKNKNKDQMKIIMANKIFDLLCIKENCFELIIDEPHYKIYKSGDKVLGIYSFFMENYINEFKEELSTIDGKEKVVYSFSFTDNIKEELFKGLDVKIKPIPSKILEILDEINR